MIYQTPEDPRVPVWDKNGQEWEPDKPGYYGRKFGSIRRIITWADLIVRHGPLTDTKIPEVGETITIKDNATFFATDVPPGTVFADDIEAVFATAHGFEHSNTGQVTPRLYPSEWTRLR
ncbi:hypothetical protein [Trueperella pyogenes]